LNAPADGGLSHAENFRCAAETRAISDDQRLRNRNEVDDIAISYKINAFGEEPLAPRR